MMIYTPIDLAKAKVTDAFMIRLASRLALKQETISGREYAEPTIAPMSEKTLIAAGEHPRIEADAVRAVMSWVHIGNDFATAIEAGLNGGVGIGVAISPLTLLAVSAENNAIDYREGYALNLSTSAIPQEVLESGQINHVTIEEDGERKPTPQYFASIFRFSNQAMQNYSTALALFADIGRNVIDGAIGPPHQALLAHLLAIVGPSQTMRHSNPMFSVDHENRVGWSTLGVEFRLVSSFGAAFIGCHNQYLGPGD